MAYWADRVAKSQAAISNKTCEEIDKQLVKYYRKALLNITDNFEATYDKLIATIGKEKEPTPADLYKLDRYWKLQNQVKNELSSLNDKQAVLFAEQFEADWLKVYESFSLPSEPAYSTLSKENVSQMINQVWCADGKSWSQRVWENTDLLAAALNEELITVVATGEDTVYLRKMLEEQFNVSYNRASTIVRTEVSHIQNQAAKERYKSYGITELQVWADEDERRCDECGELHMKRFSINDILPVPVHPNCRCSIVPVVETDIVF